MNDLDQFLASLGLNDETNLNTIKSQILGYAIELAIARLLEERALSPAEKATVAHAMETNRGNDEFMTQLINSPDRQKVLQEALTEALLTATEATKQLTK